MESNKNLYQDSTKMEKTKIRFFINSLNGGGAERVLVNLLKVLDPLKYDISLVSIIGGMYENQIPEYVSYKKILRNYNRICYSIIWHLPARLFCKVFMKKKYDVEVAYLEGFPTTIISKLKAKKKIAFVHMDFSRNDIFKSYYGCIKNGIEEYSKYDNVVFVSEGAKKGFEKNSGELKNAIVLHNIYDYKDIIELSKFSVDDFNSDAFKIIFVGRISKEKRVDRLITAVSKLQDSYKLEVIILGDGELRETSERLTEELKIKCIQFKGFVDNPYPYMAKADLLVCSSDYEGYSTVAVESLVLGTPILTTNCAGMDEIIGTSKCGLIVENNDDALLEGLIKILSDHFLYLRLKTDVDIRKKELASSNSINSIEKYDNLFTF